MVSPLVNSRLRGRDGGFLSRFPFGTAPELQGFSRPPPLVPTSVTEARSQPRTADLAAQKSCGSGNLDRICCVI